MGYRDETLAVRERILELQSQIARLEGSLAGVSFKTREVESELARVDKTLRRARRAAGGKYFIVGVLGVLVLVGSMWLAAYGAYVLDGIQLHRTASGWVDARTGATQTGPCELEVHEPFIGPTVASIQCDGRELFNGPVHVKPGPNRGEFWQRSVPGLG